MDFESSKSSSSSNAGTIEHSWKYGAGGAVPMENTYSDSSNRSSDSPPSSCSTVSTGGSSISGTMGSTYVSSYYGIEEDLEPHSRSTPLSQIMGATYASSYYGSIPPKPENLRPTPSSLLWSEDLEISDYYNLQMPATGSKEPYLLLLDYFPETSFAPRVVYLDSDPNPRKHSHPCQVPGRACWKRLGTRPVFSRPADLMRHYANFHGGAKKERISCDYRNCARVKSPYGRKDHYRDHLREFHKEDLPRLSAKIGNKVVEAWCGSSNWWRCTKCLLRVVVKENGWKCPGCKKECEPERKLARTNMEGSTTSEVQNRSSYESPPRPSSRVLGDSSNISDPKSPKGLQRGLINLKNIQAQQARGSKAYDEREMPDNLESRLVREGSESEPGLMSTKLSVGPEDNSRDMASPSYSFSSSNPSSNFETDLECSGDETDLEDELLERPSSDVFDLMSQRMEGENSEIDRNLVITALTPMKRALVDHIMKDFWVIFNQEWSANIRSRTGSPSSSSASASAMNICNDTNGGGGSSSRTSRQNRQGDDDDDPDSKEDGAQDLTQPASSTEIGSSGKQLACPYRKHAPQIYNHSNRRWRTCSLTPFDTVARVKGHLYRYHRSYQCARCGETFKDEDEMNQHSVAIKACNVQHFTPDDGITNVKERQLRSRKRKSTNPIHEERWKEVYLILFPYVPSESVPDPYFELIQDDRTDSPSSMELSNYEEFSRQELPQVFRRALESAVNEQSQPIEDGLRNQLVNIIQECQSQVFSLYRTQNTSNMGDSISDAVLKPESSTRERSNASIDMQHTSLQAFYQEPSHQVDSQQFKFNESDFWQVERQAAPSSSSATNGLSFSSAERSTLASSIDENSNAWQSTQFDAFGGNYFASYPSINENQSSLADPLIPTSDFDIEGTATFYQRRFDWG